MSFRTHTSSSRRRFVGGGPPASRRRESADAYFLRAILGYLDERGRAPQLGRIDASTTRDDRTLFVADENAMTITVIDLVNARRTAYNRSAIIGQIPTGRLLTNFSSHTVQALDLQHLPIEPFRR